MAKVWTADATPQWRGGGPVVNSTKFAQARLVTASNLVATPAGNVTQFAQASLVTTSALVAFAGGTGGQFAQAALVTTSLLAATGTTPSGQFAQAALVTTSRLAATATAHAGAQFAQAALVTVSTLTGTAVTGSTNSLKLIVVGDLSAAGGAGTVKAQIASYYADPACAMFLTIGDNVYEGSQPGQWTSNPVPFNGEVLRGGTAAANQWVFPGTGHHDWGDSGTAGPAEAGATVHSPADGLKPYFDSVVAGLKYGDGLWYYAQDLASVSWKVIHLSGSIHATGAVGPVGTDGNPLVPVGGGDVTNKVLNGSNVATLAVNTGHGMLAGDTVTVALSPTDAVFDGPHTLTAVTATSVSFAKTHAAVTSTACTGMVGTAQYVWFSGQLDACVTGGLTPLVLWSDPLFATVDNKHSAEPTMLPLWYLLYKKVPANALVLNSHKHNYERFDQMAPSGVVDNTSGIYQMVVGTGGNGTYTFGTPVATGSLFKDDTHVGVLELMLKPGAVDYRWMNAATGLSLDSGTLTMGGGPPPPPPQGAIYGTSTPGVPVLTPSRRVNIVRCYGVGDLNKAQAASATTAISYSSSGEVQTTASNTYGPINRADMRGDNGVALQNAAVVQLAQYFSKVNDNPGCLGTHYHEPNNGDKNPDGTLITAAQINAETKIMLTKVKPMVNNGNPTAVPPIRARTHPMIFGPIFATQPLMAGTPTNAQLDAWVYAGTGTAADPGVDFIGQDFYADFVRDSPTASAQAARYGVPWWVTEQGTSVQFNPTDAQNIAQMKSVFDSTTTLSPAPSGFMWFDANHNLLDTNLTGAVSQGATTITVDKIPGKAAVLYTMANGASISIQDGANTETVTLTAGVSQTSAGTAVLSVTALAHPHAAGKVVWLMPLSVAYWNGLG